MTAYRTVAASSEQPYVNPYLERVLLEYYRKAARRDRIALAIFVGITAVVGLWLVAVLGVDVDADDDGLLVKPIALFGVPALIGILITGTSLLRRRPHMLERIRTGIPIRRVKRGVQEWHGRVNTVPIGVIKEIPTIVVEFADHRACTLTSLGDLKQMARIEELLRLQMAKGSAPARRAS